ncbi:Uncharacterised protein [Mycobacteroides abscessus subsp. abscessus]|nr:Uncharacterised protein [Mycobacteroides abscessus subsp. abscessus]
MNPPASEMRPQPSRFDSDSSSSTGQPRSRGNAEMSSRPSASAFQNAAGVSIPPGASIAIPEMTTGST